MLLSQPTLQRLDERIVPSSTAGDFFWFNGQRISLTERPNQIAVRFDQPHDAAMLKRPDGPLAGFDIVQVLDPTTAFVTAGPSPRPRISETIPLDHRPEVAWSAPVFENPDTRSWIVATNEIVVQLKPGVTAESFFTGNTRFSIHRPIVGMADTFVATMSAGSGRASLALANELIGDPRLVQATPNLLADGHLAANDSFYSFEGLLNSPGQTGGTQDDMSDSQQTEFELRGTIIGTPGSGGTSGNTIEKVFDNDLTTWWEAPTAAGSWAGMDFGPGSSFVLTRWRYAPRSEKPWEFEPRIYGVALQASNDPTFSNGVVTLDTIPNFPYVPRYQLSERLISDSTPYRCFRVVSSAGGYGSIAEVKFIGLAQEGVPLPPTMSPWGGRFLDGLATVTLSSDTTTAQIYYTTDGSTPTLDSAVYTGPFSLDCSGIPSGISLKARAYDPSSLQFSSEITGIFKNEGYVPGADWYDDRGILIEAHGGSILDNTSRDGFYYWHGCFLNKWNNGGGLDQQGYEGVWAYKSRDLLNWHFVGQVLPNISGVQYIERPHVLYNALNDNYVLWAHARNPLQRAAIATSPTPSGPWVWVNTGLDPDGLGYKDSNLFLDPDTGIAYAVYTDGDQNKTYITQLAPDFLSAGIQHVSTFNTIVGREAPALFKRGDVYFLITSTSNYYSTENTYDQRYQTASHPLGAWSFPTPLFRTDPVGTMYNAQSSFVLNIPGTDQYMYGADRWRMTGLNVNPELYSSRQVWLPLTFPTATTMRALTPADWHLDLSPKVTDVSVNDGGSQRSMVTSLTVTLNTLATFSGAVGDAFTLNRTGGGSVFFEATASIVNGVTVVTLDNFTGTESEFGSLRDGRYTLTVLASQISNVGGQLNGGNDYIFDDGQGLFRMYGDADGDRRVDGFDFGTFVTTYGLLPSQTGFLAYFDYNGDGRIDGFDFGQFVLRYNSPLP